MTERIETESSDDDDACDAATVLGYMLDSECGCRIVVFPEGGAAMTRDPLCPIHNETARL